MAAAGFTLLAASPAHAQLRVLLNQVGYEPEARKVAIVEGNSSDHPTGFELIDAASGATLLRGQLRGQGQVDNWRQRLPSGREGTWLFWTADFSAWRHTGHYLVRVGRTQSCAFAIEQDVLERKTISNVIYYFKGQRASGSFNQADAHLPDPSHPAQFLDLRGGWYDATGDYGIHLSELGFTNYFDNQPVPLSTWSLLATYNALKARADSNFTQYERRLLDEGLYGADFLVRAQRPGESFLDGISAPGVHKRASDRRLDNPHYRPKIKTKPTSVGAVLARAEPEHRYEYQISFREGAGMAIAALALASTMPRHGPDGHFPPARYREAAESAFQFLQTNNGLLNVGPANLLDDDSALLAATGLYKATHQPAYLAEANRRAAALTARLVDRGPYHDYWQAASGPRPFFSPSDAGLPVVSLVQYAAIASPDHRTRALDAVRRSLEFELWITRQVNNPFGYARQLVQMGPDGEVRTAFFFPHDTVAAPWWQGENARLASLAAAARLAAPDFGHDRQFQAALERYAWDQLDWILGRNPYGACMLNGSGRGSAPYMFFGSWQYTSAPGSIVNGITAGFHSEDGIAYNLGYAITGKDTDWRWTEQWLPHAAWYLYAASLSH